MPYARREASVWTIHCQPEVTYLKRWTSTQHSSSHGSRGSLPTALVIVLRDAQAINRPQTGGHDAGDQWREHPHSERLLSLHRQTFGGHHAVAAHWLYHSYLATAGARSAYQRRIFTVPMAACHGPIGGFQAISTPAFYVNPRGCQ